MELAQIAPNVYACTQPDKGWGWSNSGFVNHGGGLVVDTLWDLPKTRALIAAYASINPEPARRLVNTHHNGDHCWGNQLFEQAEIIGHRLCAEAMRNDIQPAQLAAMIAAADSNPGLEIFARDASEFDFAGIEITPPSTLVDDRMEIDLGGTTAEVIYVGPAHTIGDVIVYLPQENVLFGGDVIWRNCTPIGWEGTYERWGLALDTVLELEPAVVVPGHGPVTDSEGVRELRDYLEYVRAESATAFERGLSELEAAKGIDLGPYADWTEPERLIFQVFRAYRELRGEPWDTPMNVPELFTQMGELCTHQHAHAS
jgi:cyclase